MGHVVVGERSDPHVRNVHRVRRYVAQAIRRSLYACCSDKKSEMVHARGALPGRTDQTMPVPEQHFVYERPCSGSVARRHADGRVRHGLLLGCRAQVLADRRRVLHRRRVRRWVHAQPHLRGGVQRAHRPRRSGAGGVRPGEVSATSSCSRCSGRTTTPRRACARATTWARSTAARSTPPTEAQRRGRRVDAWRCTRSACGAAGYGDDHHRGRAARPRSSTPSRTTSSTSAKNPNGYCGIGGTGVSCPIGLTA